MAIRTARPVTFDGGLAYCEYEYDDVTGEIMTVRGVNNGSLDMHVRVYGTDASGNQGRQANYEYTFAAGSGITEFNLSPGQRKRFTLEPDGGDSGREDYYPTLAGLVVGANYG